MSRTLNTVDPASVGLSEERLGRIDAHLQRKYVGPGRLPSALTLVSRKGQVAHLGVIGDAREDTLFRIYSMTKPLTSVLFMMLVEEGRAALEDPVSKYIPAWADLKVYAGGEGGAFVTRAADRPMRVVDLMRHTSGLTYGFQNRTPVDAAYREAGVGVIEAKTLTLDQMVEALGAMPLEFSPGDHFNYSVSTDVLGHLIAVIEDRPFDEVLQERLIQPLGMTDTGFSVRPDQTARFVDCFTRSGDGKTVFDAAASSTYLNPPVFVSGGGGLVSTAADYLRFCTMMVNGGELDGMRYLSPKTVQLMTANHLPGGKELPDLSVSLFSEVAYEGVGFGLGFATTMKPERTLLAGSRGDYFWGGAAGTYFWIDPVEELIVIFMTQLLGGDYPVRREMRTMVYAALVEPNA